MATCSDEDGAYCPFFQHAVEVVGRRWSGSIVRTLAQGPHRFGEIRKAIPGLSDRLLNSRLGELGDEGIVSRCDVGGVTHYELTTKGVELGPVLDAITDWAARHATDEPAVVPGRIQRSC